LISCSDNGGGASTGNELVVYCGRSQPLVQPIFERFQEATGAELQVRYGGNAEMAALIREEGDDSKADVYYGQDAGNLGGLARDGRLRKLPDSLLDRVDPRFRGRDGRWVGTSGRARVVVYNTRVLGVDELPDTVAGLVAPKWRGRIGWAPTNGSFQAFVTAMRLVEGEDAARTWLEGMVRNEAKAYPTNQAIFEAVGSGEIDVGLSNHYYLFRFLQESGESFPARNYSPRGGGVGAMVSLAGAGVLSSSNAPELAESFVEFLLSDETQAYFAEELYEYPLVDGIATHELIEPLAELPTPDVDLSELTDLSGTLVLLQDVGVL
jgi:iron(III) transport system substrate-binding protein